MMSGRFRLPDAQKEAEPSMDQVHSDDDGADRAVWASNMLMHGQNLFGFSCAGYERDPKEFVLRTGSQGIRRQSAPDEQRRAGAGRFRARRHVGG